MGEGAPAEDEIRVGRILANEAELCRAAPGAQEVCTHGDDCTRAEAVEAEGFDDRLEAGRLCGRPRLRIRNNRHEVVPNPPDLKISMHI